MLRRHEGVWKGRLWKCCERWVKKREGVLCLPGYSVGDSEGNRALSKMR